MLFIYLSKAFDVIDHSLLLTKLNVYGFSVKSKTFIQSYLNERMEKVNVNNKFSAWCVIFIVPCDRAQYLRHFSSIFSLMTFSTSWLLVICVTTLCNCRFFDRCISIGRALKLILYVFSFNFILNM